MEEIECCSTLNVVLGHEIVADLELDGTELGLQGRGECRGLKTSEHTIWKGDNGLWSSGVACIMPTRLYGLPGFNRSSISFSNAKI